MMEQEIQFEEDEAFLNSLITEEYIIQHLVYITFSINRQLTHYIYSMKY